MPLAPIRTAHVNQVVADFEASKAFYRDVLDADIYWEGWDEEAKRDAALLVLGHSPHEIFAPSEHTSLLGQNLQRFGESFHSFEWQVADLEEAKAVFEENGVRVTTYRPGSFFMTHPKDSHGMLFEICSHEMSGDPRLVEGFSDERWRNGAMGLLRLNSMQVAVRDLESAVEFHLRLSGGEEIYREKRPGVGNAVGIWVADMITELIEPDGDDSPVAAYINRLGPRIRSLNFQVKDTSAVTDHLAAHDIRVAPADVPEDVLIDPRDNFGLMFQFSEAPRQNDPRD